MSEKRKLIERMIAMQKRFIARERARGVSSQQTYSPEDKDDELAGYSGEFEKMASAVVDLAHDERGTSR